MNIFQYVRENTKIEQIAGIYGLKTKQQCPFHKDKDPSFSINTTKQIFKCFGCDKSGDVITLVAELDNITPYESCKKILELTGNNYTESKQEMSRYIKKQQEKESLQERYWKLFKTLIRAKWELDNVIIPIDYYKSDLQANLVKLKADLEVYLDLLEKMDVYEIEMHEKDIEYIERKIENARKD